MANTLGTAYVQIKPTTKGITGELESQLGGAADKVGGSVGASLAGKIAGAIAAAGIGAALVDVTKQALEAGGALQQSFGGLETIYGDAADQAKQFAMQAAEMGISANDYAEQAVSFGASLKQAFGGDTEKAVQAANTAIMDMTDNAAKMGTPIENIQTAYQGFAKQNYTMLDNLKLGYGGTKTEMERLLKDAEKISGVKYDITNLGDVYDAIHVIQGELGLTGVAAEEAKTTFQGSLGAMKAAAQNFLATLSTGGDITAPLTQLMQTVGTFLIDNLVPMLTNVVMAIPPALSALFATIGPAIGTAFKTIMDNTPEFLQSGTDIINKVVTGFLNNLPSFITAVATMIAKFLNYILTNLPSIMQSGVQIMLNLVQGFRDNFPKIISAITDALKNFLNIIIQHLPTILAKGVEMLGKLAAGVIQAIPTLVAAAASAIGDFIKDIVSHLPEILAKGKEIMENLVKGVKDKVSDFISAAGDMINDFKDKFTSFDWKSLGSDLIAGIVNGIKGGAGAIADAARDAARSAFEAAKRLLKIGSPSKLFADEVGRWIPAGIAVGIEANTGAIDAAMRDLTTDMSSMFTTGYSGGDYAAVEHGSQGFTQTVNIYSPQELTPAEVARQTRNATQQMVLSLNGV